MAALSIDVTGLEDARATMARLLDEYGPAVRKAVNHTVASTRLREIEEINRVYDRPVPFTTGGVYYTPMRTEDGIPPARVALKGDAMFGGYGAVAYLGPTIEGRARRHKRFEKAVHFSSENARLGIMGANEYLVPGPHAIYVDGYGNIKAGIIGKISSDLGFRGATPTLPANRSFFLAKRGNTRGIFERAMNSAGDTLRPLLVFTITTSPPQYRKMFAFWEVGDAHIRAKYNEYFGQALDELLRR